MGELTACIYMHQNTDMYTICSCMCIHYIIHTSDDVCLKHVQSMASNVCACVQLEGVFRDGVLVRGAMCAPVSSWRVSSGMAY